MNRSVVVNLIANVQQWNRGLRDAASAMTDVTGKGKQQVGQLSTQVGMLGTAVTGFASPWDLLRLWSTGSAPGWSSDARNPSRTGAYRGSR